MEESTKELSKKELEELSNIQAFKEEAIERLGELEAALLELEESPQDQALIDSAFRAMHTIKGSGGMFGFDEIVQFTHNIETVFDKVRDGSILINSDLIALTLSAHDQIGKMLEHFNDAAPEDIEKRELITSAFLKYLPEKTSTFDQGTTEANSVVFEKKTKWATYRIRFKPSSDIFSTGTNPLLLINELRELGECQVVSHVSEIPGLKEINPEDCYVWWDIVLNTHHDQNAIQDVFIFVEDQCEIVIELIDSDMGLESEDQYKRLGEILVDRGDIMHEELQQVLADKKKLGEELEIKGLVGKSKIQSALAEQNIVKSIREKRKRTDTTASIRVSSNKLDKLVDLVGELVTAQARLTQIAGSQSDSSVTSIAEEIERLTGELRDNTMSVRMLTFGTTFNKFKRLVRDLSAELEKEIVLVAEGSETELDKSVIELLNDPLVHLLRNAADHGIETPEVRSSNGKPQQGLIKLSASYAGAHVLIKIEDNGWGMDPTKIRDKAIAKGIISKDNKLSDKESLLLIFEAGFSTAQKVTNVSGRGVGMDVVKKAIENLRGSIDVESEENKGTKITLKLPLTLAIIDGLLVKVGDEFFVIPLAAVEECIELTQKEIKNTHGRHLTNVRGQIVPYIRLRDQFKIESEPPPIEQVVITEIDNNRIGFVVDSVVGQHQTVIKNLSRVYKNIDAISGATIMADGTVALILDINKHFQFVEKEYLEQYS